MTAEAHATEPEFDPSVFTPEEWSQFRRQDLVAGKFVVGLMLGIFSMGVVLYLIVVYSVMNNW